MFMLFCSVHFHYYNKSIFFMGKFICFPHNHIQQAIYVPNSTADFIRTSLHFNGFPIYLTEN